MPTLKVLYFLLNAFNEFLIAFFCAEVSFLVEFFRFAEGLGILFNRNTKFERDNFVGPSKTYEYVRREIHRK